MSTVRCDIEVDPGRPTGSKFCGDRAFVLQEGQRINALAGSIGHAVAAPMALVHALAMDCMHRKWLLILVYAAPALVHLSMLPFLWETLGAWSVHFYYFGSVVGGLTPKAARLVPTVWLDLTEGDDGRRGQMVVLRRVVSAVSFAVAKPISLVTLRAELLDLSSVFMLLFVLAVVTCRFATCVDVPRLADTTKPSGRTLWSMISSVADLCWRNPSVLWLVSTEALQDALHVCEAAQMQMFALAVYQWRQGTLMTITFASGVLLFPLLPLVLPTARRFGERRFYFAVTLGTSCVSMASKLLLPVSPLFIVLLQLSLLIRHRGLESLQVMARARMPQNRPGMRGRSSALLAMTTQLLASSMTMLLSKSFDASARTYWSQARPVVILFSMEALERCLFMLRAWPLFGAILDELSRERLAAATPAGGDGEDTTNKGVGGRSTLVADLPARPVMHRAGARAT
mmetsp:Transcript_71537/g.207343  ORF Transcript_71537/g.207343 Transcript_71537/m.207343 type:complete len:457 (-) Transcript_71537:121-1491(-)